MATAVTKVKRQRTDFEVQLDRVECPFKCWDCIRAAGLTPPKALRSRHKIYPYDKTVKNPLTHPLVKLPRGSSTAHIRGFFIRGGD